MTQQPPRNVGPDLGDEQSTSLPAPFPVGPAYNMSAEFGFVANARHHCRLHCANIDRTIETAAR